MNISLKFKPEEREQLGLILEEYNDSDMTQEAFVELIKPIMATQLEDAQTQLLAADPAAKPLTLDELVGMVLLNLPPKSRRPPFRVSVRDGSGQKELGLGTYVGDEMVWVAVGPGGEQLLSSKDATVPPTDVPDGYELQRLGKNPKIQMDNGDVVYGCQVWWEPVEDKVAVPLKQAGSCCGGSTPCCSKS
jgi:hypothetical protein